MKIFSRLSKNDFRALVLLLIFFALLLFYWALSASFQYKDLATRAVSENHALLKSLYGHGRKISYLEKKRIANTKSGSDQSLLTVVSNTAKDKKIVFKRFQPNGDNELELWLENANFNVVLWWLSVIEQKNGIHVSRISVEQTDKQGFVDARITLMR